MNEPRYQLPPLTLGQLEQLTHALEVVSAGEADPDAEVFRLLDLVRHGAQVLRGPRSIANRLFGERLAGAGKLELVEGYQSQKS
ncbi:hypothetical protein BLL42_27550 (plasmid) [Pseudomonas frederiksbergensis]|uniref:Uncharacterized protein n=1 Tax=Pseudomonas frederiksbergensis TaxID=104087 RepID=A0A1J0EUM5_9PSED|nr:hypothetical protein [Pseudomonas frederiksbergensis]APC19492.1 hypothetical protein BLL42_27550 [Pseudomonas frederiksbergensis]